MGSPSSRLDIPENLRPWVEAGLEYLLKPVAVADQESTDDHDSVSSQPVHDAIEESSAKITPPAPSGPSYMTVCAEYGAKLPAGSKIVFTYPELVQDLQGNGDPRRGELLRRLLGSLAWPKGTSGFLPMTDSSGHIDPQNGKSFWSQVLKSRILHVVCFGYDAGKGLYPGLRPDQTVVTGRNSILYILPPINQMLGLAQADLDQVLQPLKTLPF